jgi:hypothetical protein
MPHSLVVEPHQEQITFGFPAVSALFMAADEAYLSWPGRSSGGRESRFEFWRGDLLLGDTIFSGEAALAAHLIEAKGISKYDNLISVIDSQVAAHDGIVSNWIDASLNNAHVQTPLFTGILANSPLQMQWPRGRALIEPIYDSAGRMIDGKLNTVDVALYAKIYTGERAANASDATQAPLLKGQMVMAIDPQGSIYLGAQKVKGEVLQQDLSFDADMLLLVGHPVLGYGIEGGLWLYDLETAVADVDKAGAVAGFTLLKNPSKIGLLYVGAALDLKIDVQTIGKVNVGGSVLFGRLDPGSPVLATEYGDLFAQMSAPAGTIIQGGYMRVYANNVPIFKVGVGCLGIDISGGGEVAWWIFTQAGVADNAWGTRLGVNAMGKAFCVASAKASIILTLDNDFGQNGLDLTGEAWAGAGCGFCKPENWHTKADVLNDKGCLKCIIDLYFVIPMKGSATKSKLDFNAACPF